MQKLNYTEKLKKRFAENGGRLFFADGSKARAFSAVRDILVSEPKVTSCVCVTGDVGSAKQIRAALGESYGFVIIDTVDEFEKLIGIHGEGGNTVGLSAAEFKAKYPYIIITLDDKDEGVLNCVFRITSGKAGEYNEGEPAGYAISDFLAEASYGMVIVDEVYKMFNFRPVDMEKISLMTPQKYERLDLLGNVYFTDIRYSYKKLSRLIDSAAGAIVISDVIVDRDVISLYAGLSLVHSNFSYKEAKAFAESHARDIISEIDQVCGSASYCPNDSTILSLCLQKAKSSSQMIPTDLESLGAYFSGNLDFMTQEEKFLRIIYSQAKKRFSMNIASNDVIIRILENDDAMAGAFCDVFFDDELKGDIEKSMTTSHLAKMNTDDVAALIKIFKKYAELCDFEDASESCRVKRIYHEDSGFEDLVRRSRSSFDRVEDCYSASMRGDDLLFKSIAVSDMLSSGELRLPLLAVSDDDAAEVCAQLKNACGKEAVPYFAEQVAVDENKIVVISYKDFGAVANYMDFASAVFFDVIPDINLLDTYVKKAIDLGKNCNAVVLSSYDDISGVLIDMWQESWFDAKNKVLPIRSTEVFIKGDAALDYNEVIGELDSLYECYKNLIEGSYIDKIEPFAEKFSSAISRFTLRVSTPINEICDDFRYFSRISEHYTNIFANSMCIGAGGREAFTEVRGNVAAASSKKAAKRAGGQTHYEPEAQENTAIFNICVRQLHETCDYKNRDCIDCERYNKYKVNDISLFAESVRGFFRETERIMDEHEKQKLRDRMNLIINSAGDNASESYVSIDDIREAEKTANTGLTNMMKDYKNIGGIYYVNYARVLEVREAVQSIYSKLFGKYYNQLIKIFDKATNKMKTTFETAGQSAKQSLGTL